MKKAKVLSVLFTLFIAIASSYGQGLAKEQLKIDPNDIRIEQLTDGGYHLYIKAKPFIKSVLLVESTKDPNGKVDNYTYRSADWNPINGDEKRILNGEEIKPESKIYSLIDSTPEEDKVFGQAFHVFIPWVVYYGYSWSRNGAEFISDGTFINIRAFSKPYADYTGEFLDNPYKISVTQRPSPRPAPQKEPEPVPPITLPKIEPPATVNKEEPKVIEEPKPEEKPKVIEEPKPEEKPKPTVKPIKTIDKSIYMPETMKSFETISKETGGDSSYSVGRDDIVPVLGEILDSVPDGSLDLVICIDTTESMADDIDAIKESLPLMVKEKIERFTTFRLGLVLYKDYFEDYVVKCFNFTSNVDSFTKSVSSVRVQGGRDIPEAVYEALYEALTKYPWQASERKIVLVGDAPPHPIPRGKIDHGMVKKKAKELSVSINTIILPH